MPARRRTIVTALALLVTAVAPSGGTSAVGGVGSLDATFNAGGSGPNDFVSDIAIAGDGSLIIVGGFTEYNGVASPRIARLDADGALDTAFATAIGTGADARIDAVDVTADGDIYIAGLFTTFNGDPREGLVRLNADGSIDTGFAVGYFKNSNLPANKVKPRVMEEHDGVVYVGGGWDEYYFPASSSTAVYADPVMALDATGAIDVSGFRLRTVLGGQATAPTGITVAPDGDIVLHGIFQGPRGGIVKLNPGSYAAYDETFEFAPDNPTNVGPNNTVTDVEFIGDKVIAVGNFTSFHGDTTAAGLVRLMPDGSLDPTFPKLATRGMVVTTLAVDDDENIYLAGGTSEIFGLGKLFGRLTPDGTVDPAFPAVSALPSPIVASTPDGQVFVFGITSYNSETSRRLERIVTSIPPTAPGDISVVTEGTSMTVSWSLPSGTAPATYRADAIPVTDRSARTRGGEVVASTVEGTLSCTATHPATSCTITDLVPGTTYRVQVSSILGDDVATAELAASVVITPAETTTTTVAASPVTESTPDTTTAPVDGVLPATGSDGRTGAVLLLAAALSLTGWWLVRLRSARM